MQPDRRLLRRVGRPRWPIRRRCCSHDVAAVARLPVEIALVGGDGDLAGMLDDQFAARHEHLVEGQRADVGAACGPSE